LGLIIFYLLNIFIFYFYYFSNIFLFLILHNTNVNCIKFTHNKISIVIFIMTITKKFITIKTFLIWSFICITIDFTILKVNFYLSSHSLICIVKFIKFLAVLSFTFIVFSFSSVNISTLGQSYNAPIIMLKCIIINYNLLTYYFI